MPYLLTSARRDALRVVRNAADDVKPTRSERFAIVGATVLDGASDEPRRNAVVLIEDGRIARIGSRAPVIPGARADGWSVSDLGWGPGALARGILAVRLAAQDDAALREVQQGLDRDGGLAPRVLAPSDTVSARVLREGDPADFVVVQGALRQIPTRPSGVRWVSIGGRLYSAQALRGQ